MKKLLLPLGALGGLFGFGWLLGRDKEQPQSVGLTQEQSKEEEKTTEEPKLIKQEQRVIQTTPKQTTRKPSLDYLKALFNLSALSQYLALEYSTTKQAYENAILEYTQRLEKLVPAMSVLAMKTPLSALTSEDLPLKVLDMFKYKNYSYAIEHFPRLIQGYYIAKANGLATDNLTDDDLIAIADNPALAVGVNENYLKLIVNLSEVLKTNIKTHLDLIGKMKDEYNIKLNTLKKQADIIKTIVQFIQKEKELDIKREELGIKWYKAQTERLKASQQKETQTIPQIQVEQ